MISGWSDLSLTLGVMVLGSAIAMLTAATVCACLKRSSSAVRHVVWLAAFVAILVLPVARILLPAKPIVVPSQVAQPRSVAPVEVAAPPAVLGIVEATPGGAEGLDTTAFIDQVASSIGPLVPAAKEDDGGRPWSILLAVWALGSAFLVAQMMIGAVQLRRIRTDSPEKLLTLAPSAREMLSIRAGLRRKWSLRVSRDSTPPAAMTWGSLQPVVLLPDHSPAWTEQRLEAVLLHELAHVRRWDSASQVLTATVCALYWFNPFVWLGARAMRSEAESAADDAVLATGIKPSAYAAELLRIGSELGRRRQPIASVGVSVMKQAKIESRVVAILDSKRRRRGVSSLHALAASAVGISMLVPLAVVKPILNGAQGVLSRAPQVSVAPVQTPESVRLDKIIAELAALQAESSAGKVKSAVVSPRDKKHASATHISKSAKKIAVARSIDQQVRLKVVLQELAANRAQLQADHKRFQEVLKLLEAERQKNRVVGVSESEAVRWLNPTADDVSINSRVRSIQKVRSSRTERKPLRSDSPVVIESVVPQFNSQVRIITSRSKPTALRVVRDTAPTISIPHLNISETTVAPVEVNSQLKVVAAGGNSYQVVEAQPTKQPKVSESQIPPNPYRVDLKYLPVAPQVWRYGTAPSPGIRYIEMSPGQLTPPPPAPPTPGIDVFTHDGNWIRTQVRPAPKTPQPTLEYDPAAQGLSKSDAWRVFTSPFYSKNKNVEALRVFTSLFQPSQPKDVRSQVSLARTQLQRAIQQLKAQQKDAKSAASAELELRRAQEALDRAAAALGKGK